MTALETLIDRAFGPTGDDMHGHLLTLYALARFLPSKVTVEIGTDDGSSTLPLLLGTIAAGGVMHSVDPATCEHAHALIEGLGVGEHWTHHKVKSDEFVLGAQPDLVFIDGDHSYQAVLEDLLKHGNAVSLGGIVALHDSAAPDYPGVGLAVHDFLSLDRKGWEHLRLPWCYGLTICRRIA